MRFPDRPFMKWAFDLVTNKGLTGIKLIPRAVDKVEHPNTWLFYNNAPAHGQDSSDDPFKSSPASSIKAWQHLKGYPIKSQDCFSRTGHVTRSGPCPQGNRGISRLLWRNSLRIPISSPRGATCSNRMSGDCGARPNTWVKILTRNWSSQTINS